MSKNPYINQRAYPLHAYSCRKYIKYLGIKDYKHVDIVWCICDSKLADHWSYLAFVRSGILLIGTYAQEGGNSYVYSDGEIRNPIIYFSGHNKLFSRDIIDKIDIHPEENLVGYQDVIITLFNKKSYKFKISLRANYMSCLLSYLHIKHKGNLESKK